MIAAKLVGGLGNQMFQYATARSLSISRHTKLILDLSHYDNVPAQETPRHYELDCFNIQARLTNEPVETAGVRGLLRKIPPVVIREDGFEFNKLVLGAPNNSLLIGHWQSEKYFTAHKKQLREDLSFIKPVSRPKEKMAQLINHQPKSVSIHVRRSDYVSHPISSKFNGALTLDYYNKAVEKMTKKLKDPHFFIFSDDLDWCKANINFQYPVTFVDEEGLSYEDMRLMSLCKHHIIANSSFSWWGAWLSANTDKIVVAPKSWFREKSANASDIVPDSWIKI